MSERKGCEKAKRAKIGSDIGDEERAGRREDGEEKMRWLD